MRSPSHWTCTVSSPPASTTRTRGSTRCSTATGCRPCATLWPASKTRIRRADMTSVETQGTGTVLAKNKPVTQNMIEQFLYREARYLDDREFEKGLQCYANKGGLQDRVFRIRTERSSATSLPEPRTSHNISNVEVIERRGDLVDVRFNWHTMYFRYKTIDPYYGTSFYTIDFSGEQPLIRRKTVVLKNDYIHHVVDVYHF